MQRIASLTFDRKKRTLPVCDFRVAAVTTKSDLEVPVHVNQDERELLLAKTLENPQVRYETEFPYKEEVAGMKKEMLSMKNFDVFDEAPTSSLSEEALSEAISTPWVKVRKSDGTVRCRIVVRGYTQQVDDRDELFAYSTPSLTTLKLLLTLSSAFGWHIATGDVSTAFLHAAVDGNIYVCHPAFGVLPGRKRALEVEACTLWPSELSKALATALCGMHGKVWLCAREIGPKLVRARLYVLAYVDDLMFFCSKPDIDLCVQDLQKDLLLKMTGALTEGQTVTFLGREIRRTADACELYMKPEYIDSMLQLYNMSACKPAAAPGEKLRRRSL